MRHMEEGDRADVHVRLHEPRGAYRSAYAAVATRAGRIVGAAWYTDSVSPNQPWYRVVEPHIRPRALFTANIFVVPGDKGAAWAISKGAAAGLATAGVRTLVSLIGTNNQRSILMARLVGCKMIARVCVRRRFGRATTVIEPITEDRDNRITTPTDFKLAGQRGRR